MSIKTWKEEFYLIPAKKCSESEALEHSVRKWTGLTEANLEKHKVGASGVRRISDGRSYLTIDAASCALCKVNDRECDTCVVYKTTGDDCIGMYARWLGNRDPQPMIKLLQEVARRDNEGLSWRDFDEDETGEVEE